MSEKFFQNDEKTWQSPKYFQPTENTIYKGDYFFITKIDAINRKTPIYYIFEYMGNCIGEIKWYSPWRKFCFYPSEDTVWDCKCLMELIEFITRLNNDYKDARSGNNEKSKT